MTYHQIGRIYPEQRLWEEALNAHQEAMDWDKKTGQVHELGMTYHQLGRVHKEKGEFTEAKHYFQLALENISSFDYQDSSIPKASLERVNKAFESQSDGSSKENRTPSSL